jgi:hypothetical protein
LTDDVNPQHLLGATFQPLVSLAVAVILYDSGLALEWGKVSGRARRVLPRLVYGGVPITMALAALLAWPLLSMSGGAAVMTGAILVVSGPTVVGPLLAFVRPSDRPTVRPSDRLPRILSWEGSLIDPIGGIGHFLLSLVIGGTGAAVGAAVLWLCLCKFKLDDALSSTGQLACVVVVAAVCDIVEDDAGLIAALLNGIRSRIPLPSLAPGVDRARRPCVRLRAFGAQ